MNLKERFYHLFRKCANCVKQFLVMRGIMLMSIIFTAVGIGIAIWFVVRGISYEGYVDASNSISLENSSQFGDFIGGCVGTLFALTGVLLLFETLKLQRQELTESRYVFQLQQFDSLFFNSLNVYHAILKDINDKNNANGRDFFQEKMIDLQNDKNVTSSGAMKLAYWNFYAQYEPQVAHYFRTLYQIFNQIKISPLREKDKLKFAKIVRSQLSLGELFFLYYNGRTEFGRKFRGIINEFNLLKHLSIVDMPEFKKYFNFFNDVERHTSKVAFYEISKGIKNAVVNKKEWYKAYLQGLVSIKIMPKSESMLEIHVIHSSNARPLPTKAQQGVGFMRFTPLGLKHLFSDFIDYVFCRSNYHEKNPGRQLKIDISTKRENRITTISYRISRMDDHPLQL